MAGDDEPLRAKVVTPSRLAPIVREQLEANGIRVVEHDDGSVTLHVPATSVSYINGAALQAGIGGATVSFFGWLFKGG